MSVAENSNTILHRPAADPEVLSGLLAQIAHLTCQLRFNPEDRQFYVPIILQLFKSAQVMESEPEIALLIESGIARMMRHEYSVASAMMKSAALLSSGIEQDKGPRLDIETSKQSPWHAFFDQILDEPKSAH